MPYTTIAPFAVLFPLDCAGGALMNVVSSRGVTVEGVVGGPVTFLGVGAEHSWLYQYSVVDSSGITIVMAQTETQ